MKTKKLNFEDFASNELSRNQKMAVQGKGDPTAPLQNAVDTIMSLLTPTTPPGTGTNNGEGRP